MASAVLLLSLMIGSLYAAAIEEQSILPSWVECTSHLDCRPGSCCTIGQQRYSIPMCSPQPTLGEQCRPSSPRLTNTTLGYPDGSTVLIKDAYLMLCPCSTGLSCDSRIGVCQVK
ncbi:hypothetical protein TSAR_006622 [Trichomalopsis sarcophagae]|uniref:Prokineticin domain-containing protein n=1 Tax=Trichomalopsis sarcophagae TaxID=543379 RepID=A0A232F4S9_9HYME|nr:hypothetical protein TSAR_006622 [Trichomalopsis sarcophagae]